MVVEVSVVLVPYPNSEFAARLKDVGSGLALRAIRFYSNSIILSILACVKAWHVYTAVKSGLPSVPAVVHQELTHRPLSICTWLLNLFVYRAAMNTRDTREDLRGKSWRSCSQPIRYGDSRQYGRSFLAPLTRNKEGSQVI